MCRLSDESAKNLRHRQGADRSPKPQMMMTTMMSTQRKIVKKHRTTVPQVDVAVGAAAEAVVEAVAPKVRVMRLARSANDSRPSLDVRLSMKISTMMMTRSWKMMPKSPTLATELTRKQHLAAVIAIGDLLNVTATVAAKDAI